MCGRAVLSLGLILAALSPAFAKETRFWNLTAYTITALQLSPAGADHWGLDQTINDPDHAVDHDERLNITAAAPGTYDVKFTDKAGRTCVAKNIVVQAGKVFSIQEKELTGCGN